jgi:acetyl esterase/lipase
MSRPDGSGMSTSGDATPAPPPARSIPYGDHPLQVANLHLPTAAGDPWPCVVLLHGGFWRSGWDRTLMTPLALDLARRGVAAWNIEYRGTGRDGGGWPTTLFDVAAALDHLADVEGVDATRIVTCGHSAGGQLALWLAARPRLGPDAPGAAPRVAPVAAVAQAGVADLRQAAQDGLGDDACTALLGGSPDDVPERYGIASPTALLPLGVPMLLVHGLLDAIVPVEQSRAFATAAERLGDVVELLELDDADHFHVIDPEHRGWTAVVDRLPALLG